MAVSPSTCYSKPTSLASIPHYPHTHTLFTSQREAPPSHQGLSATALNGETHRDQQPAGQHLMRGRKLKSEHTGLQLGSSWAPASSVSPGPSLETRAAQPTCRGRPHSDPLETVTSFFTSEKPSSADCPRGTEELGTTPSGCWQAKALRAKSEGEDGEKRSEKQGPSQASHALLRPEVVVTALLSTKQETPSCSPQRPETTALTQSSCRERLELFSRPGSHC